MSVKARYKDKPEIEIVITDHNYHGVGEVIVLYSEGDMSSEELKLLEPIPPMTMDEFWRSLREMEI